MQTLSFSPLLANQEAMNKTVMNVVAKLNRITSLHQVSIKKGRGGEGGHLIDRDEWAPIEKESAKLAVDSCHGIMYEHMKADRKSVV